VGGAIRDKLLGLAVKEQDYVVVGASPEHMIEKGFKPVGKDFPVFLHPVTQQEYALARTERKNGPGYKGFQCYAAPHVTLEEDLKRRDLTINALAESLDGQIIDPYNGLHDLENKILRHVSWAFVEDPVRILRVARFMARFSGLGFQIADETLTLMQRMVHNGEVNALVPERIWREFSKALQEANPEQFIMTLYHCGALKCICPEFNQLFYISQKDSNLGLIAIQALQYIVKIMPCNPPNIVIRFAALMQYLPTQAAQTLAKRWRLPTIYRDLMLLSTRFREKIHQITQVTPEILMNLLEQLDAFRRPDRFKAFLAVCTSSWCVQDKDAIHTIEQFTTRKKLLLAYEAARSISVTTLLKAQSCEGDDGKTLGLKLKKARIKAIHEKLTFIDLAERGNIAEQ